MLDSPVEFFPLAPEIHFALAKMGFSTVRESFRAALAGRLASRKKGGKDFEDKILEAGCAMLGHPIISRQQIKDFAPGSDKQTVADALLQLHGRPFDLSPEFLTRSIRDILLPSSMHQTADGLEINTISELLNCSLQKIQGIDGPGMTCLGSFLIHIFDYIFIVNEQQQSIKSLEINLPPEPPTVHSTRLLAPWFTDEKITEGHDLIKNRILIDIICFRHGVGGLFLYNNKYRRAFLLFEEAPQIRQGFRISHSICEICRTPPGKHELCEHLAALTISILDPEKNAQPSQKPFPLFFRESPWNLAGQILFDLYGQANHESIVARRDGEEWMLSMPNETGRPWITCWLDHDAIRQAAAIFGDKFQWLDLPPVDEDESKELISLFCRLTNMARTTTEAELNSLHKRTLGQERDESVWMWLTSRMCLEIPLAMLQITRPADEPLFILSAKDHKSDRNIFALTLPRTKVADLIDGLAITEHGENLLAPAHAFFKVSLIGNADITVTPFLRLPDGREIERDTLEENRYGRYYYLEGEGFLPVREQHSKHSFCEDRPAAFTIKARKLTEFIEKNYTAIQAPENIVPESLRQFKLQDVPDNLELDSFSMDDDWCYLSGHYGLGNDNISLAELLAARKNNLKFLPGGDKWLQLTGSPLEWLHSLDEDRLWHDEQGKVCGLKVSRREMLLISGLIPEINMHKAGKGGTHLRQLLDSDRWQESPNILAIPEHLRDYQRNGVSWLMQIYQNRLAGILADDMGLGKTHQALALLRTINNQSAIKRKFLVVCPATVVPHWAEKIDKFFPEVEYFIYHGSRRKLKKEDDFSLMITTYGIIRRDTELLTEIDFEVIILDEVQQVKNKKTGVYSAAARLNGKVIIGLTGTPLENSVYDLKSIFDICLPGFLGSDQAFRRRYANPIEEFGNKDKKDALARLIHPFLLRRTRSQVLKELPDIIEDIRTCRLSDDQIKLYREVLANQGKPLIDGLQDDAQNNALPYMKLLAAINYLKQICDHPCLVQDSTDPYKYESGKWDLFVELLDECMDSSMKVVIFSHYTKMLDIIETHLREKSISFCGLRGDMPLATRQNMIQKFNNDESCRVFSASLLAGGIGIDLTAAHAVIHYDRWWNAAREDQATARVHRMGQKNVVQVFKLITIGTLEEKINHMIIKKRDLASHLVRVDDDTIIKRLSRDELLELLSPLEG